MKKQALLFFALLLCASAYPQGVRYDVPPILNSRAVLVPNANISLCPGTATITNSTCSPASTQAFTDITLTTPCATGSPVVLPQTNVCSGVADALGNAGFWLSPGAYIYCINGPTITGKCYNLTVPAGSTSGGGLTAAIALNMVNADSTTYPTLAAAQTQAALLANPDPATVYVSPLHDRTDAFKNDVTSILDFRNNLNAFSHFSGATIPQLDATTGQLTGSGDSVFVANAAGDWWGDHNKQVNPVALTPSLTVGANTNIALPAFTISTITESVNTVTVTTSAPCSFGTGDTVEISGVTNISYNTLLPQTVLSPGCNGGSTFTYTYLPFSGLASSSGGTVTDTMMTSYGFVAFGNGQTAPIIVGRGTTSQETVASSNWSMPAFNITAASETANTVTFTVSGGPCTFVTGTTVSIMGLSIRGYNGPFKVLAPGCNSTSTFQVANPISGLGTPIFAGGGHEQAIDALHFASITVANAHTTGNANNNSAPAVNVEQIGVDHFGGGFYWTLIEHRPSQLTTHAQPLIITDGHTSSPFMQWPMSTADAFPFNAFALSVPMTGFTATGGNTGPAGHPGDLVLRNASSAFGIRFLDSAGALLALFQDNATGEIQFNNAISPAGFGTKSLGSAAHPWGNLGFGTSGVGFTNIISPNATAQRNVTFPDQAGNITLQTAATSQKSETGADATLLSFTPLAVVGTYRVCISMAVSAQNTATLGWTATWTDSNGSAQAPTNLALNQTGVAAPALTFTAATNGNYFACQHVDINNAATAIVVKTTFAGTSIAYKASATIERLQ